MHCKCVFQYDRLQKLVKDFQPFTDLWTTTSDWMRWHESWLNDPLSSIDSEQLERNVTDVHKVMNKCVKHFKDIPGRRCMYDHTNLTKGSVIVNMLNDFFIGLTQRQAARWLHRRSASRSRTSSRTFLWFRAWGTRGWRTATGRFFQTAFRWRSSPKLTSPSLDAWSWAYRTT